MPMAGALSRCRQQAVRLLAEAAPSASRRAFNSCTVRAAAQNFVMPAMSPTMTEGNIAAWKIKEGDSFSAGDVLLEIETDKAQMDVEAQEDGVLAKITMQDGAKAVKVGARIAVIAEQSDDLGSLQIPPEESQSSSQAASAKDESKSTQQTASTASSKTDRTKKPSPTPSDGPSSPQKYPLYPSVQHLLHSHDIPLSEANKIPASGPNGRLLKGDVLAFLGQINKSYPQEQKDRLAKLSHLDLSNIKLAKPKQVAPSESSESASVHHEAPPSDTVIALPISLSAVLETQRRVQNALGLTLPLATFVARASELANENLPRPRNKDISSEELFDAVLGLRAVRNAGTSRGSYVPEIAMLNNQPLKPGSAPHPPRRLPRKRDIIDELTGTTHQTSQNPTSTSSTNLNVDSQQAVNIFKVTAKPGEEKRARTYLERLKTVLEAEPGSLVL